MGKLIYLSELRGAGLDSSWYFETGTNWNDSVWPNPTYPHCVPFPAEIGNIDKIRIRKWIESFIEHSVIFSDFDASNYILPRPHGVYLASRWYCFCFEFSKDATAFKLAFSDLIKPFPPGTPFSC